MTINATVKNVSECAADIPTQNYKIIFMLMVSLLDLDVHCRLMKILGHSD